MLRRRALVHCARYAKTGLLLELATADPDPLTRVKALYALRGRRLEPGERALLARALAGETLSSVKEAAGELLGG